MGSGLEEIWDVFKNENYYVVLGIFSGCFIYYLFSFLFSTIFAIDLCKICCLDFYNFGFVKYTFLLFSFQLKKLSLIEIN